MSDLTVLEKVMHAVFGKTVLPSDNPGVWYLSVDTESLMHTLQYRTRIFLTLFQKSKFEVSNIIGMKTRQITIRLDPDDLAQYQELEEILK